MLGNLDFFLLGLACGVALTVVVIWLIARSYVFYEEKTGRVK